MDSYTCKHEVLQIRRAREAERGWVRLRLTRWPGHALVGLITAVTKVFRILISQIKFSRFKSDFRDSSDFGVSYRILASYIGF